MHRLTEDAKGVYLIAATPFAEDGALDLAGIDRLVDFYLGCGVHGLTILGMMGEANKLTAAETEAAAARFLKAVDGRVPVIVGASATALATVTDLSRKVMDRGAAGVMVAPSGPLKTDDQIFGYMEAVTAALGPDVPVVYQDYPQSTGIHLSVPLWNRIADAFPSIVMLKHEDCPGLAKLSRVRADEAGRRRVSILVGNGALYYLEEMERGADGAMTGFGFPEMLVGVYDAFTAGDRDRAAALFDAYMPFTRYEQQPGYGLAVRKEILRRRGAIRSARARWPAPSLGREGAAEVDRLLLRLRARLADIAPEQAAVIPV
ncbi:MAG: dihydrodipicolinate synthase family protein [Alphaproteobacteria bacterium]